MTSWSRLGCSSGSPRSPTPVRCRWRSYAATHREGAAMKLQSCSDHSHGLFVSVDGPGGAGKTTIVRHLAQLLVAQGAHVHVTAEPSSGPMGVLASILTETVTGRALACLYAADRYHHVETEV